MSLKPTSWRTGSPSSGSESPTRWPFPAGNASGRSCAAKSTTSAGEGANPRTTVPGDRSRPCSDRTSASASTRPRRPCPGAHFQSAGLGSSVQPGLALDTHLAGPDLVTCLLGMVCASRRSDPGVGSQFVQTQSLTREFLVKTCQRTQNARLNKASPADSQSAAGQDGVPRCQGKDLQASSCIAWHRFRPRPNRPFLLDRSAGSPNLPP